MVSINAIQSFIKASGVKSILQTKPNVFKGAINPAELKLAKTLKNDTVELSSKKISSWFCDANPPVAKEGLTNVAGHHNFHGWSSNNTMEETMRLFQLKCADLSPERYQKALDMKKVSLARTHMDIYDTNKDFLKLMPQPKDSVVWRARGRYIDEAAGSDFDVIKNAKIGETIVPANGFTYAAHVKANTSQYLGLAPKKANMEAMLMEIRVPKGSQISVNMEHGGEAVFPGFSKYKLISKETRYMKTFADEFYNKGEAYPYTHAVLEYIPEIATEVPKKILEIAHRPIDWKI